MTGSRLSWLPLMAIVIGGSFLPCRQAEAGGTHFLIQLQAGFATSPADDMGLSIGYGLVVGCGGRIRTTRVRLYGLVTFDRATFTGRGRHPATDQSYIAERAFNDFQAGLRVLVPIFWRLRWYLEALAGNSYMTGSITRESGSERGSDGWSGLLTATTGFEVRYLRHFATGIRAEVRWLASGGDVLTIPAGQGPSDDFRITVQATQAFLF